jgi:small-conductance mechanosensitive channel
VRGVDPPCTASILGTMLALATDIDCPDDALSCRTVFEWTGNETVAQAAAYLVGKPAAVIAILGFALLTRWLLHKLIDRVVQRAETGVLPSRRDRKDRVGFGSPSAASADNPAVAHRRQQRVATMGSLLKSVVTGVVLSIGIVMALSELGLDVAPIIASAGIVGVALGFGAQSLVSDFLSGIFMILEDQYGVGDEVDLGEAYGVVEAVSLRVTRLRDLHGTVWYVRNGEIIRVGNASQNWSRTVLDVGVGYGEDLTKVKRVLEEIAHDLWEDEDFTGRIIEEPSVWGVQELGPDGVSVRVALKTAPGEQWGVAREMRSRIKNRFDHEGIEIPFPQRVLWHRGDAPADLAGGGAAAGDPVSSRE